MEELGSGIISAYAGSEVFGAYCRWFFEITEYLESVLGKVPEIGNTRALSYAAEALTSIYFTSADWITYPAGKSIYT